MYIYHHGLLPLVLGISLNLFPKYSPTSPEMPEPIGFLSPALTLAYSLLNMLALQSEIHYLLIFSYYLMYGCLKNSHVPLLLTVWS